MTDRPSDSDRAALERGATLLEAWAKGDGPPHANWREVSGAQAAKMRRLLAVYDSHQRVIAELRRSAEEAERVADEMSPRVTARLHAQGYAAGLRQALAICEQSRNSPEPSPAPNPQPPTP